ncbi:hypothetical protein U1737_17175 [Sphingomonas sp. LB3N6]|uniref:hypothetical protein n=1 Tax=Sphingomonas fucosidasi TaxID=3096164 RepID=UPI002FCAEAC5
MTEHSGAGTTIGWGSLRIVEQERSPIANVRKNSSSALQSAADIFTADYRVHKSILTGSAITSEAFEPRCYLRFTPIDRRLTTSSSDSMMATAETFYRRAEEQLGALRLQTDEDGDALVESGALDTATEILGQLKTLDYAPPELSWHGGDAVVMLWAAEDATFAITVTDDEWGYVLRRGGKQLRIADSIKLTRLALQDLR